MGHRRSSRPPVEITLDRLDAKGPSGTSARGDRYHVRAGCIGDVVAVQPGRKGKAREVGLVTPSPDRIAPACPVYGLCGGCQLQPMPTALQRAHKADLVARLVDFPCHGCDAAGPDYGYRNKLELSFGARRFLEEAPEDRSELAGSWLGFHPPGWFSRIVDVDGCPLGTPAMNRAIATVKALAPGPAWDNTAHVGHWRHVVLRQGDDGVLVTLVTHPDADEAQVRAVGAALFALDEVSGVLWRTNDGVAEVAEGPLREVLHGDDHVAITLSGAVGGGSARTTLRLPATAFFQVNTSGAGVLFDRVAEALRLPGDPAPGDPDGGPVPGTLVDLYCGVGAIGLHLGAAFEQVVGVELLPEAIEVARDNAAALGISGQWHAGPVEAVLPTLDLPRPRRVVVDPPRVGLHPKAAAFLADLDADVLVYVACNPASLGRDRALLAAGGWRLTDLWAVDLFPQTRHVEAVGRFVRA